MVLWRTQRTCLVMLLSSIKKFGAEEDMGVHLGDHFWDEEDKISSLEDELLEAHFSNEEIKAAVFYSCAEGAPGPNGFSFLFYQTF